MSPTKELLYSTEEEALPVEEAVPPTDEVVSPMEEVLSLQKLELEYVTSNEIFAQQNSTDSVGCGPPPSPPPPPPSSPLSWFCP